MLLLLAAPLSLQALADDEQPLRDPTAPLGHKVAVGKASTTNTYELNSILISAQRKLAIINGQTLREGQTIAGSSDVRVASISAKRVVLQQANKRWELSLSPTMIRKH